ncbi:MAG TPA: glucans biosynthesis glucosyltransferase MdoH [Candidatus Binatia bacterium]|nr:glucans biosynthesis glucosyltransferase MdoH [Candidatus Binatia bacterium]
MGDGATAAGEHELTTGTTAAGGRLVQNWRDAHERALAYLDSLAVPDAERSEISLVAVQEASARRWTPRSNPVAATLDEVRRRLTGGDGGRQAFSRWRLVRELGAGAEAGLAAAPPLRRRPMGYEFIRRRADAGRSHRPEKTRSSADPVLYGRPLRRLRRSLAWTRVAHRRRLLLVLLILVPTAIASAFMVNVLPHQGGTWLEVSIVAFFGVLFGWVSVGFWTALFGFVTLARGRDRFAITGLAARDPAEPTRPPRAEPDATPTAIIMPIANEPVERVFAGLQAVYRSLERAGAVERFHFFVLSDSNDPDVMVAEEAAWAAWCRAVDGFGRIFYRRRRARIERKSGNVADFCRRWGANYRYMVTLDADSLMAGATIVRLVELMDMHPHVGMIQTAARAVNRRSLFARVQQFASHVYGPMFAAGLHWWQLGDGQYWGHNTIIRVAPFMEHCGLPRLRGREPLGGEILSHDFVEAALMGRAGWSIWLAYDLGGSWEEVPSTLLEEMKRDRRWCQGNLQHLRLLFTEGLFGAHRALFLTGVFSYVSAALWFAFLSLSTVEAVDSVLRAPDYFPHGPSLFPEWPIWRPDWAMWLMAVIGVLLFLPKVLAILLIWIGRREARAYGGLARLSLSVLLEILVSSLLAPIRMAFHTRFVLTNLLGRTVAWGSSGRMEAETGWGQALRHHGLDSLVASVWGAGLYWLNPSYFWWITPIVGALLLSIPLSVVLSRVRPGDATRRWGLFRIPEETDPPPELRDLIALGADADARRAALPPLERTGFVRGIVDPYVNAIHRAFLRAPRHLDDDVRATRQALVDRGVGEGPEALGAAERRVLLLDPDAVDALHERVWALEDRDRAARWGRPGARGAAAVE